MMKKLSLLLLFISISIASVSQNYETMNNINRKFAKISNKWDTREKDREKFVNTCRKKLSREPKRAGAYYLYMGQAYSSIFMKNKTLQNDSIAMDYFHKSLASYSATDTLDTGITLYNIGLIYLKNREMRDLDSAYYYFEKATHHGDRFCGALGNMFQFGINVEISPECAFEYLKRATYGGADYYADLYATAYFLDKASEGQLDTVAFRQYQEAVTLQFLGEVNNQKEKYEQLLLESAKAGYVPAMLQIVATIKSNESEAWLMRAIENDYLPAIYHYAETIELKNRSSALVAGSQTLSQNQADAFQYYLQSAVAGFPPGQCSIGVYYFYGLGGINRDPAQAKYWYQLSANQGYPRAKKLLADFDKENAKIEMAELKTSLDELSQSIRSLSQTISQSCDKSQNMTPAQREAMQRNGYSRVSGNTPSKETNNTGKHLSEKFREQHVYDDYASMLTSMKYGLSYYSNSDRLEIQKAMADIRTRWEKQGYQFFKSPMETWDGQCEHYKK